MMALNRLPGSTVCLLSLLFDMLRGEGRWTVSQCVSPTSVANLQLLSHLCLDDRILIGWLGVTKRYRISCM